MTSPCQNKGFCVDTTPDLSGYHCMCQPPYDGPLCETRQNPCVWPVEPGLCNSTVVRYYYDRFEEECLPFNYTGMSSFETQFWYERSELEMIQTYTDGTNLLLSSVYINVFFTTFCRFQLPWFYREDCVSCKIWCFNILTTCDRSSLTCFFLLAHLRYNSTKLSWSPVVHLSVHL